MVIKANRSERLYSGKGQHKCQKRGCQRQVPNHLFACGQHWHALPAVAQQGIYATAHLNLLHPDRRAAFLAADKAWEEAYDV